MRTNRSTHKNPPGSKLAAINLQGLRGAAGEKIYERGEAYFRWGRVEIDEITDSIAICYVRGNQLYRVSLSVAHDYLYMDCDCPFAENGWICKHQVAAALAVFNHLREQDHLDWQKQLNKILGIRPSSRSPRSRPYYLFFSLQQAGVASWRLAPYILPLSAFPPSHRNQDEGLPPERLQEMLETTPELDFHISKPTTILQAGKCLNCSGESVMLANLISDRSRSFGHYPTSFPLPDYLTLAAALSSPVYLGTVERPVQTELEIFPEHAQIHLEILKNENGLNVRACAVFSQGSVALEHGETELLYSNPLWVLAGSSVFHINDTNNRERIIEWIKEPNIFVPQEEETSFLEKFFLPLAELFPLDGATVDQETLHTNLVKRLYLSEAGGKLQVQLRFGYQEFELAYEPDPPKKSLRLRPGSWMLVEIERQRVKEEAVYRTLSEPKYHLKRLPSASGAGLFGLRSRTHPIDFLLHSIPLLTKDGFEIYGEQEIKSIQVNRTKPSLSFSISSGTDWFDLQASIQFGELKVSLSEIRKALRKKERYIKLADGSIGEIPENWLERYKYLFGLGKENQGSLRYSNSQIGLLDQLLEEENQAKVDREFRRRRERLRNFTSIAAQSLPGSFNGELRSYQQAGYNWLHFLDEFGFGGCLADDMGLGKTIQALVYLQSQYETAPRGQPASLVVVPRSLLVNWQREANRFTPELRLLEFFAQDRTKDVAVFDQYDVIITTYGIMRRDISLLKKYTFRHVILDESQTIKNPLSQTSRAARQLAAKQRLALTGTPVENSTAELWSLFAFLNPGLLGSLEFFKREFSGPIEKKGDEQAAQTLRKMVFPFILRRTKKQVAPELPPRTDKILYCDMEPAQRKFYLRMRDTYRGLLLGMLEHEGINASRMKILEGLLRLRQISNHPRLVEEQFRGTSGKFELLLDTLTTLRAEGHKVLVFSQFVQMLKILRQSLDHQKMPYLYLDGQTRNRQERVDEFQNNPKIPLFLISLKAGGVGLNLTAADYVIHIDPWWNPAVEMQATDRTHRIGQEKPVFVYKFITRDTVEEKILILQDRKRELVDSLISSEKGFFKSLTSDDIQVLFGS